jgi:5-formyltetrahydrofolate cyclo-ligase
MTSLKAPLRQGVITARRKVSEVVHTAEANALAGHVTNFVTEATICAYVPVDCEPGSTAMLDTLHNAGIRVLLPFAVTTDAGAPLALLWGEYRPGELVVARFGLLEPAGPRLPATAIGEAGVVIVPALAVDRRGVRLGRGAGFYDRSLTLRDPAARLVAVVRDEELLDEVPAEPHDVPMTHALTPGRGVVTLGSEPV